MPRHLHAYGRKRTLRCSREGLKVDVHRAADGKRLRSGYLYGAFLDGVLALVTGWAKRSGRGIEQRSRNKARVG